VTVAFFCWRAAVWRSWRQAMVLALMGGLLGAVALGALAGARRTATAYGRYLASIHASDVFVNVPGKLPGMPVMRPITLISSLPGVVSHATYVGLNGLPVVHGRIDHSFLTNSLNGSLDGEYLSQDRMTVLAGRLPRLGSTTEIVLTPALARLFGTGVGGTVTYVYQPLGADGQPTGRQFTRSYRVAAVGEVPPALVDQSDAVQGAILPPGATRRVLAEYFYAWIGLRLARGVGGIPALQADLVRLARQVQRQENRSTHQNLPSPSFTVSRSDVVRNQVQQAIRPEAIALSVSDEMRAHEADPKTIMQKWALLTTEVASVVTPIRLLMRSAAVTDPEIAALLQDSDDERLERMRHHARFLAERGYLRNGVTVTEATDILWTCSSVEIYELLVLQRGWPPPRFAQFIAGFMIASLLPGHDMTDVVPHKTSDA
jgi:hypothetical protein